jgi:hypothetical protein
MSLTKKTAGFCEMHCMFNVHYSVVPRSLWLNPYAKARKIYVVSFFVNVFFLFLLPTFVVRIKYLFLNNLVCISFPHS